MSSSDRGQRSEGERERPRSFSKFVRRTSKILGRSREQDAIRASSSTPTPTAPVDAADGARPKSPAAPPVPPKGEAIPTKALVREPPVQRTMSFTSRPAVARESGPEVVRATARNSAHHHRLQEQKARAMFAKYNMTLEDGEWQPNRHATDREWVEKKVRLRVHRVCHRCQTGFGNDKLCKECGHTRCKKCPRSPDKSLRDYAKLPITILVDADPIYTKISSNPAGRLTMQGKNGTELIRKHPKQRIRRTCHKCQTLFIGAAQQCEGCKHLRCSKCPREPAKTSKYPNGYPGDTEETFPLAERYYRAPRQRVRWQCHSCQTYFIEHSRDCTSCHHQRCDDCKRIPPKKVKKEHDPEVVRSLEQKLGGMSLRTPA